MSNPSQFLSHQSFVSSGIHYYVVGRFAFIQGFFPVAGNLLHHSIEMILKAHLVQSMTLAELKALGHSLPRLWDNFKQRSDVPAELDSFDESITALDDFESIRYPDKVVSSGVLLSAAIHRIPRPQLKFEASTLPASYRLVLEDIDELVSVILRNSKIDPLLLTSLLKGDASEFYTAFNNHAGPPLKAK